MNLSDVLAQAMQPIVVAFRYVGTVIGDVFASYRRHLRMHRTMPGYIKRAARLRTPALPAPMAMLLLSDGKERDQ